MKKIGIFAFQGAFLEHEQTLDKMGVAWKEIRQRKDFSDDLDALILPGGESTVQGKLMRGLGLFDPVRDAIMHGMPVFATCAGMILLAKEISNDENLYFGVLNATVRRNAYGRQLGSFRTDLDFKGIGKIPAVFIRAPYIESAGKGVDILAETGGNIVAVRQDNLLATSFHPELTDDTRVHEYFMNMIK